jgi:hypothetical protein
MKVQDEEAKDKIQLPLDFLTENLVAESDGANPTSPQNAPPMIQKSRATDKKSCISIK